MDDEIESRLERIERELDIHQDRVRGRVEPFAARHSLELEKIATNDLGQDYVVFRVDRCLNRTDFVDIVDEFVTVRLYTPEENSHGDWTALEAEL